MKLLINSLLLLSIIGLSSANYFGNLDLFNKERREDYEKLAKILIENDIKITPHMVKEAIESVYGQYINSTLEFNDEMIQCFMQIFAFIEDVQVPELWPISMIDAFGKVNSGYLRGNFRAPGHFSQCVNLEVPMRNEQAGDYLRGKHCLVGVRGIVEGDFNWSSIPVIPPPPVVDIGALLPPALFLDIGVCFPAVCSDALIDLLLRVVLAWLGMEPTSLFYANKHQFCSTLEVEPLSTLAIGAVVLIGLGFLGAILATIYELVCLKMDIKPNEMTAAMSIYSNGKYLFNLRKKEGHIQSLYGLRALSLIWLMLGYRFILAVVLPLINPLDFVLDFTEGYFAPWIFASQLGVDSIFFINATLITFLFMSKMERTGRVRIWKLYLYRLMRVTPFIGILILFLMTLTQYSSDGPYFTWLTEAQTPACEQYWWSAMFHLQNYVNPDSLCVLHTWMFSVDMQLFWAAPLILFPLFFLGGWFLLFVCLVLGLSIACASTVAYFNGFQAFLLNMIIDPVKLMDYLRMIFFATHVRMGPWLIGVFCGYVLYRIKDGKFKMNWFISALLWLISISGLIAVVYLLHPFIQILDNNTHEISNILYIGFARNVFALCLAWIVIGCYLGTGYLVNWILSLSFWMPISRMGISVYIITLSAQMVIIASQKTPLVFGFTESIHAFFGDFVLVMIFSSMTYLMIERPIMRVMKHLLGLGTKRSEKGKMDSDSEQLTFKQINPWKSFY